ncbi:MAG: DUF4129 domain-containing protein [Candidatus Limnocylindria bacterium]
MRAEAARPQRPRGSRALVLIVTARGLCEAVTFSIAGAFVHAATVGRDPIQVWPTAVGLFGATLVLSAVLRERGTVRQSATATVLVIAAFVAWGLAQPVGSADAFAVLSRVVGFAIAGEAYLWRVLGLARGLQRWREVRNAGLLALGAIVVASLVPGQIDREGLPALALTVSVAAAVAMSLARSTEELALFAKHVRGAPAGGSATGTAFAIGLLAIGVALVLPAAQRFLGEVARAVGPPLGDLVFLILLPIGYVAAYLVYLVLWLRDRFGITPSETEIGPPPGFGDDLQRLREVEEMRPFVFGTVEIVIALVAAAFAVALVARLVQEHRATLPEGVSLERESVRGIGLGATLGTLLPQRARPRRAPAEDGTRAGAVRRLYWRLLELAERVGPGWREPAETPAEHARRLAGAGERWRAAAPLVRAFEEVRYGEGEPDESTLAAAREALRRVEGTA